ncbi:hypothetical protein JDV02_005565 [Purpureocillium takamizusanense]|uniref:Altered inheritance of mitochondria protein 24, mitochondrial n=1 Tax=Purpureocillium takamizusanense TaxID=2060973 RepID=A0A9Q8QGV2_9HYPO|nr:uncharacterized protein JDV02_005565 [Purpureocillium takamizusanense]UNI19380.1 hypothetical protein JDV02_005565 [Purpureocillium takamizusanense]
MSYQQQPGYAPQQPQQQQQVHHQQQQHYPPPPTHALQQQQPPQQTQQQYANVVAQPGAQHLQHQQGPAPTDSGAFHGGTYNITHRDTNAVLGVNLQPGAVVRAKPGAMIHMAGSIQLTGKVKFSMKKLLTGSDMAESTYAGPGRLALGPTLFGDIITLHLDGRQSWTIGKDAFLACTPDVSKEAKAQGFSKALFSGEDLFVYRVAGQGIIWLTSFGAVDRLDVGEPFARPRCLCAYSQDSSSLVSNTSSTTAILSHGVATIKSKGPAAEPWAASRQARVSCVASRALGPSTCRRGIGTSSRRLSARVPVAPPEAYDWSVWQQVVHVGNGVGGRRDTVMDGFWGSTAPSGYVHVDPTRSQRTVCYLEYIASPPFFMPGT